MYYDKFAPVDETIIVTFPDIPGVITEGADFEDAFANAQDALAVMLFHFVNEGTPAPIPHAKGRHLHPVPLIAQDAAKLGVYKA